MEKNIIYPVTTAANVEHVIDYTEESKPEGTLQDALEKMATTFSKNRKTKDEEHSTNTDWWCSGNHSNLGGLAQNQSYFDKTAFELLEEILSPLYLPYITGKISKKVTDSPATYWYGQKQLENIDFPSSDTFYNNNLVVYSYKDTEADKKGGYNSTQVGSWTITLSDPTDFTLKSETPEFITYQRRVTAENTTATYSGSGYYNTRGEDVTLLEDYGTTKYFAKQANSGVGEYTTPNSGSVSLVNVTQTINFKKPLFISAKDGKAVYKSSTPNQNSVSEKLTYTANQSIYVYVLQSWIDKMASDGASWNFVVYEQTSGKWVNLEKTDEINGGAETSYFKYNAVNSDGSATYTKCTGSDADALLYKKYQLKTTVSNSGNYNTDTFYITLTW